jgi:hypothetical protein
MSTARRYDKVDLADALFISMLQESDDPSPDQVRAAIDASLTACDGDCRLCAASVAQEAGDHPEQYLCRMRWALQTVERVYGGDGLPQAC